MKTSKRLEAIFSYWQTLILHVSGVISPYRDFVRKRCAYRASYLKQAGNYMLKTFQFGCRLIVVLESTAKKCTKDYNARTTNKKFNEQNNVYARAF